jgi:hypothetical protein
MPTTTDAELSLINDAEFLEELSQFDPPRRQVADPVEAPRHHVTFDGLDHDLPVDMDAPQHGAPLYDREPIADPYDEPSDAPVLATASAGVPMVAAALVLLACLTAGAASAAFVFYPRLTQIIATPARR